MIQYLGHVIPKEGLAVDLEKFKFVLDWPILKDMENIRSFMGITRYYHNFKEGFSIISHNITSFQNNGVKFEWMQRFQ